jgi:hypothetical protein
MAALTAEERKALGRKGAMKRWHPDMAEWGMEKKTWTPQTMGSKGGKRRAARMTREERKEQARKAALTRWRNTTSDGAGARDTG